MTENEDTAAEEFRQGEIAFRLRDETPVYEQPDASGEVLAVLPAGSLVTVRDDAGPFLRIATEAGRLVYMPDSALVTLLQGFVSNGGSVGEELERSRRRDALAFLSKIEDEAERAKREPGASPGALGVVSAAVGLLGLLAAHAISGMTSEELMVFFGLDILLPLVVLTANPKAPLMAYSGAVVAYLALVTGYVAI